MSGTYIRMTLATADEAKAREEEVNASFDRVVRVREAIINHAKGKRGVVGEIVCPICQGMLRYTIASSNGHVHARCSTENCVSWME